MSYEALEEEDGDDENAGDGQNGEPKVGFRSLLFGSLKWIFILKKEADSPV